MQDLLENAKEELKRVDHLVYVTLKYTRTVDVFISIIERLINAYEFIVDALIKHAVSEGRTVDVPDIPLAKAQLTMTLFDSKKIRNNIQKYLLFRKLIRSNYEKRNEFRRHVTMSTIVDGNLVEVTIDSVTEDFHAIKDFVEYVERKVSQVEK